MKIFISLVLAAGLIAASMSSMSCTPQHTKGAVAGAAIGGIAGALLDHRNPWRGGVIGGALGAAAGATIADISMRGSREAYRSDKPVEYQTDDGRGKYRAEPESDYYYDRGGRTRCKKVRERVWEDGYLTKDTVREVCEDRYERRY